MRIFSLLWYNELGCLNNILCSVPASGLVMFIHPQMVNSNLANLAYRMLGSSQPLFTVETLLSAPEVVLHPPANELCKLMTQAMREVVEG